MDKFALRGFGLLLTLFLCAMPSFAEAPSEARRLYEQGAESFRAGRYWQAVDFFRRADAISAEPELEFNIALAYEEMKDAPGALEAYRSYLRRAPESGDRAEVERHIHRLEQELGALGIQQVSVVTEPPGATIFVDGKARGVSPWTGEIPLGRHQLLAELRGYGDAGTTITASPDRALDVNLVLEEKNSRRDEAAVDSGRAEDQPEARGMSRVRPATWVLLGIGGASLIGAVGYEFARAGAREDEHNASTDMAREDERVRAESHQTASHLLLGVGSVALLSGGAFLYFDLKREERKAAVSWPRGVSARWSVGCRGVPFAASSCGVHATGSF